MTKQTGERRNGSAHTTYVVLKQETLDGGDTAPHEPAQAWLVVGEYNAPSKVAAIRVHTGDGADVIEGTWKAVPLSSWRGGETTRRVTAAAREVVVD